MISAVRVTVGDAAVALNVASAAGQRLTVRNVDTTDTCDLGGSDVVAGAGFPLAPNTQVTVELAPGDVLFAVRSSAADVDVAVLRS